MRARSGLAMVVVWAAIGGCGAPQVRDATRAAPSAAGTAGSEEQAEPDARRAEIERLERQIDSRTAAVPPAANQVAPPGVARPEGEDAVQSCEQACEASGSICRAAARICTLAGELDTDWARGKCRRASRTCTDVRRRMVGSCGSC